MIRPRPLNARQSADDDLKFLCLQLYQVINGLVTCMEPGKKTKKIPGLPVPAGLMIFILLIIAAGCTGKAPEPSGPQLDGTGWTLSEYIIDGSTTRPLNEATVTLFFEGAGRIAGSSGCNRYSADYKIRGTGITIGPAGGTEMYCAGTGVMEQESTYLRLLPRAVSVTTGNDRLTFADAKGTAILSFARIVPPAPEPLVGTNWTLDTIYKADTYSSVISGTTITAVFDKTGSITGSGGCNKYLGSYTVNGSSLAISSVNSNRRDCHDRGILLQEDTYLTSLNRAAAFTINGNRLSVTDANGAILLVFTKGS